MGILGIRCAGDLDLLRIAERFVARPGSDARADISGQILHLADFIIYIHPEFAKQLTRGIGEIRGVGSLATAGRAVEEKGFGSGAACKAGGLVELAHFSSHSSLMNL